jgi:hypothetical protein
MSKFRPLHSRNHKLPGYELMPALSSPGRSYSASLAELPQGSFLLVWRETGFRSCQAYDPTKHLTVF